MRWSWSMAVVMLAACKDLPHLHELPDAPVCGNHMLDPGEVCDGSPDACIPPGQPDACQIDCSSAPCPTGWSCDARHVCEMPASFTPAWSGDLAFSNQAFAVTSFDPNVDAFLDLVGADATGIHVRRGDGSGGFLPAVDLPYPDTGTGVVRIGDFDSNGVVDVMAALAGTSGKQVVVLSGDGSGGVTPTLSIPIASDETVLAIAVVTDTVVVTNFLIVIVDTPTGRVLRGTPQDTHGVLGPFESAPAVLADLPLPVLAEGDGEALAVAPSGGVAAVNEIKALTANPGPGTWIGPAGAVVTAMHSELDPPIPYFSSSGGVFSPWAVLTATPARSNAAWAEAPGTFDAATASPVPLLAFVANDGQLTFAFDGSSATSPLAPVAAPIAATAVRSGDVDRDGLRDLVLGDGTHVVVMRGKGHLSP